MGETFLGPEKKQLIEMTKLQKVLELFPSMKDFGVTPVGDSGYIISKEPRVKNDKNLLGTVEFDVDDTLVHTTEGKRVLKEKYSDHLKEKFNIVLSGDTVHTLINQTEGFASWKEFDSQKSLYHPSAHMSAIEWITEELRERYTGVSEQDNDFVASKLTDLLRIKKELDPDAPAKPLDKDPFYFRADKKFVLHDLSKFWSEGIRDVFFGSFLHPRCLSESFQAASSLQKDVAEIGVFTFGDPTGQLYKTCELLADQKGQKEVPFSHILLTKGDKGKFLQELSLIKEKRLPDGVVVVVDDSPDVLKSVVSLNNEQASNNYFAGIRYRLKGGYNEEKGWELVGPNMEVTYEKEPTPDDVIKTILFCRFRALETRFGADYPDTISARDAFLARYPQESHV